MPFYIENRSEQKPLMLDKLSKAESAKEVLSHLTGTGSWLIFKEKESEEYLKSFDRHWYTECSTNPSFSFEYLDDSSLKIKETKIPNLNIALTNGC